MSDREADCGIHFTVTGIGAGDPTPSGPNSLGVGSRAVEARHLYEAAVNIGGTPALWSVRADADGIIVSLDPHPEAWPRGMKASLAWAGVTAADARALSLALRAAADMDDAIHGRSSKPA